MRRLLLASTAVFALTSATLHAGGVIEPEMQPDVIVKETASSSNAGIIVPLLLILLIAAAASGGSSSGGGVSVSDVRLKQDLRPVGATAQGLSVYRYRYAGFEGEFEGVMAQDVAERFPEAIVPLPGGYMAVNYALLGLEMKTLH